MGLTRAPRVSGQTGTLLLKPVVRNGEYPVRFSEALVALRRQAMELAQQEDTHEKP